MVMSALSSSFSDPDFWQALAPNLTIEGDNQQEAPVFLSGDVLGDLSQQFHEDGYLLLPPVFEECDFGPLRDGILALERAGLPPVFIYLYDQPYVLFARLQHLIGYFLGDRFALLPNFWAWNIPVREGARGWAPHQDCQAKTRFPNGEGDDVLMSLSLWVPLTDATLDNGCMSVLPRSNEPYYNLPLDDPDSIKPEHGVALPAQVGSVLGWSQDLYHWSNRVTKNANASRLSLSLEFQNRAFDPLSVPLLDVTRPPPFKNRLELVRQQFSRYKHMEETGFVIDGTCDKPVPVG